jgi:RNA polymerase sigma factor (sigma-70 family)
MHESASQAAFNTTQWSLVLAAGESNSPESQEALDKLCRVYWFPLYAFLRRRGHASHDAQDLVQDCLLHLIERRAFRDVSPAKGKFRSFLIACLNHRTSDGRDRAAAQKRGGSATLFALDAAQADQLYELETRKDLGPDQLFDRRWAMAVLEQALERLSTEQTAAGKAPMFALLRPFLTDTAAAGDYEPVAAQLGLSPNGVAATVARLRQRYRELVRLEVAATVSQPSEVEAEMQHLLAAIRG